MIVQFFTDYGFIIELLVVIVILVRKLKRKSYFLLRVFLSIMALFLFAYLWKNLIDVTVLSVIFRHSILAFMTMYAMIVCFETGIWASVFIVTIAWTIQHVAYEIGFLFQSYIDQDSQSVYGIICYIAVAVVVYTAGYFLVGNRLEDEKSLNMGSSNKELVLIAATLILFASVFKNVFDFLTSRDDFLLLLALTGYDLISCFLVLLILLGILKRQILEHDARVLEHVLNMQKDQLENSKKNMDVMNIKYHDLKYLISSLNEKFSSDELESLNKAIASYDLYMKTGNEALDVILAEKKLQCEQHGIKINCIADGQKLNLISASEVYSLFGNAIDNAVRALENINSDERKIINISVKESMSMISIVIENHYVGELSFEGNLPTTTKENKLFHGFGMRSIKMIVEKYNGFMTVNLENSKFILSILLDPQ